MRYKNKVNTARFKVRYRYKPSEPYETLYTDSEVAAARPKAGVCDWNARERKIKQYRDIHTGRISYGVGRSKRFFEYSKRYHVDGINYTERKIFWNRVERGQLYIISGRTNGRKDMRTIRVTNSIQAAMMYDGRNHKVWIDKDRRRSTTKGRKLLKEVIITGDR